MRKGDNVTIYEDPVTETRSEGRAKLVKNRNIDGGFFEDRQMHHWSVRFLEDPERVLYDRWILEPVDTG